GASDARRRGRRGDGGRRRDLPPHPRDHRNRTERRLQRHWPRRARCRGRAAHPVPREARAESERVGQFHEGPKRAARRRKARVASDLRWLALTAMVQPARFQSALLTATVCALSVTVARAELKPPPQPARPAAAVAPLPARPSGLVTAITLADLGFSNGM